ncbi:hypothetical protein EV175_005637, partial [Coemansia sp. RSA 1933]
MTERIVNIAGTSARNEDAMDTDSHGAKSPPAGKEAQASGSSSSSSVPVARVPGTLAQQSVEGWVVVATGIHEEAREDDLQDFFGDYGRVHNLHLNLDRQTGYVKGYALIEYASFEDASRAAEKASGRKFLGQPITVDFAFVAAEDEGETRRRRNGGGRSRKEGRT